jgi:Fe-S oxidoreductase
MTRASQAIREGRQAAPAGSSGEAFDGPVKVLTSCPSCLQGLSRYEGDVAVEADYIVVEIARHVLGADWMPDYVRRANDGGIERVLV